MKENRRQDIEWSRQEYEQKRMSEEQVENMKKKIEQAKAARRKKRIYKISGAAAAAVAATESVTEDTQVREKLEKSAEEINAEIAAITDQMVAEFEENLQYEQGYQDILVKTEVLETTEEYFTLKLICYQGSGSGAEWDYFYTIDLDTGERLQLKDIFVEGADYITPISENIKTQMREQMAQDEMVCYWIDYDKVPEWNFESITDETSFYLNADGDVVISFDEGEVAPMYMGVVEFTIPSEVLADIRK